MKMTAVRMENMKLILEKICWIKPGMNLLIIADDYARAISLASDFADLANVMGAEAVMAVFRRRTFSAEEPPKTIAAAMKVADVVLEVTEGAEFAHSSARKEATDAGLRRMFLVSPVDGEDNLEIPIKEEDWNTIKERTDRIVDIETKGKKVRLTTAHGTDIIFSIEGRQAISLSPMSDSPLVVAPFFAESAIAPVEGTTEGVVVVDSFVQNWKYMLQKPIRFKVKAGKVLIDSVYSEVPEQIERFKKLLTMDDMANNCAAELGIGTSHTVMGAPMGWVMDKARLGHVHLACGRNYDLGGESKSVIHQDVDMTRPTLIIDDVTIMEDGQLKI